MNDETMLARWGLGEEPWAEGTAGAKHLRRGEHGVVTGSRGRGKPLGREQSVWWGRGAAGGWRDRQRADSSKAQGLWLFS